MCTVSMYVEAAVHLRISHCLHTPNALQQVLKVHPVVMVMVVEG